MKKGYNEINYDVVIVTVALIGFLFIFMLLFSGAFNRSSSLTDDAIFVQGK